MRKARRRPEIVMRDGKPTAVILGIRDYEEMLERLEDAEDLRWLRRMRKNSRHVRDFEEVVAEIERA